MNTQNSADDYGVTAHGTNNLKSFNPLNRAIGTNEGGLQNSVRSGGDNSQRIPIGMPDSRGDG